MGFHSIENGINESIIQKHMIGEIAIDSKGHYRLFILENIANRIE